MSQGPYLRKYGVETTVDFQLFETDGVDFKTDAAHASGDTKIMKDEGAEANTSNGFVDEGQGYSITLTATEMQAARIVVYVVDQSTKVWLDTALVVETYGHASAMHAFDLDTATVNLSSTTETQIDNIEGDTNELQTDLVDGGRLDLLIDAIKAVTDNLPDSGALNDLAAILADTGTDGVALAASSITASVLATGCLTSDELAATALTAIADAVISRGVVNVESSADMDSLASLILARLHAAISGTTLTLYKTDDATTFDTYTITKSASADPITSVADPA